MHGARPRRVARARSAALKRIAGRVGGCLMVLALAACHGSGAKPSFSPDGTVDAKTACAALAGLNRSSDALDGINVSDPEASETALTKAIAAYSTALVTFEQVGPADLRARAEAVRAAVIAHHFRDAIAARAALDAWAVQHCS
jgi:hypothetical protein